MPTPKKKVTSKKKINANPMSWRRKTVWFFHRILIAITLLGYACAWVSPEWAWPAAFIAYLIPVCFALHFFFMYLWYKKDKRYMLYSIATLAVGYPFIMATVAINFTGGSEHDFSLLSYNTKVFNVYGEPDKKGSQEMINWLLEDDADIKCLQEFYSKQKDGTFDVLNQIKKQGKYYYYVHPRFKGKLQTFGLAILSKYPMIKAEEIKFSEATQNAAAYADILLKKDTVRIINIHLESLHVSEKEIVDTENIEENSKNLFKQLKKGFQKRARQLAEIQAFIKKSPHPVVLCGDLNDLPYSYTYVTLKSMLRSSFEDAANGFGFSYNGKLFFLRIDNQFYSGGLKPISHYTLRYVEYSDHFPIKARYQLR